MLGTTVKIAKRSCEEFQEVSEVSCESPNAKIHAVVESLSPMKKSKSCSYFDELITDGKTMMQVFGFEESSLSSKAVRKQWL